MGAGREVYQNRCLACHGENATGGPVYGTMVGGIGDLGAESGTAPGQPAWGTRAVAPSAGEGLWVG